MAQSDNSQNSQVTITDTVHSSKSLDVMNELRKSNTFCDITLKISSIEIRAHKIILASNSDYFRNMLCGNFSESDQSIITIHDIDVESTKNIIDYFYTSIITINYDNVEALLETAYFLWVSDVIRMCRNFLQSTLRFQNCLHVQRLIDKFSLHDLQEGQNTFYSNLSQTQLNDILHYFSGSEEKYYLKKQIINKWISRDPVNRRRTFTCRAGLCRKY